MSIGVHLRAVADADLAAFSEHQFDPDANQMVGSVARAKEEFLAHWAKTAADSAVRRLTVVCDGEVAGYVGSFERLEKREVCYWLGRKFWGQGIATRALGEFLRGERKRPLYARVSKHNCGSIRVLEKSGFVLEGTERFSNRAGETIEEFVFRYEG